MESSSNSLTKPRIEYIDLLKCFAMFSVVWMHTIGDLRNTGFDVLVEPLHTFFVTYHMPLFFMINGFFFVSSLHLSFKEVLRKRFFVLIIPHIAWVIILALANWGMAFLGWRMPFYRPFSIPAEIGALFIPDAKTDFWFLRELFVTEIIAFTFFKIFKKLPAAFIGSMIFVLLFNWLGLTGRVQRFMMPIFWTGILLKAYHPFFTKHVNKFMIGFGIVFAVCYHFFDYATHTIYFSDFPPLINIQQSLADGRLALDFTNIGKSGFRFLTGVAGSIFFFALFQRFWKKNAVTSLLCRCGQLTLAIYALQSIVIQRLMGNILDFSNVNIWIYRLIIAPIGAVFVFSVCVLLTRLIQRNKPLTFMLFGSSVVNRTVRRDAVKVVDVQGAA